MKQSNEYPCQCHSWPTKPLLQKSQSMVKSWMACMFSRMAPLKNLGTNRVWNKQTNIGWTITWDCLSALNSLNSSHSISQSTTPSTQNGVSSGMSTKLLVGIWCRFRFLPGGLAGQGIWFHVARARMNGKCEVKTSQ